MAAVLELLRYTTIGPLGLPHETICDTEVLGFHVPKGTYVSKGPISRKANVVLTFFPPYFITSFSNFHWFFVFICMERLSSGLNVKTNQDAYTCTFLYLILSLFDIPHYGWFALVYLKKNAYIYKFIEDEIGPQTRRCQDMSQVVYL